MAFDLSNPKILLGLLIGGMLPYLITEVLATLTKWMLFVAILGRGPRISTLLVVALADLGCLFVALWATSWLGISALFSLAAYPLLATFPNLLLLQSPNHHYTDSLVNRSASAFALGLLDPLCWVIVYLALAAWFGKL